MMSLQQLPWMLTSDLCMKWVWHPGLAIKLIRMKRLMQSRSVLAMLEPKSQDLPGLVFSSAFPYGPRSFRMALEGGKGWCSWMFRFLLQLIGPLRAGSGFLLQIDLAHLHHELCKTQMLKTSSFLRLLSIYEALPYYASSYHWSSKEPWEMKNIKQTIPPVFMTNLYSFIPRL